MTNNEIIYSEVNAKYHTPEQRRAILALAFGLHWRQWFRRGASRCRWWG